MSLWTLSHKYDELGASLADRHYNRRTVGSPQFVPPGRSVVLIGKQRRAVWVSWQSDYIKHAWPDCWGNTLFRSEGEGLASELITSAVAATRAVWGEPPPHGVITFVDPDKVRSSNPGYCYRCAGFELVGRTLGGHGRASLLVFQLPPERFPAPAPPAGFQPSLFESTPQERE